MHEEKTFTNHRWLAGGLVLSLLLNVLVICSLAYGGRYLLEENEGLKSTVSKLNDKLAQVVMTGLLIILNRVGSVTVLFRSHYSKFTS